jgi:hypothetical protein
MDELKENDYVRLPGFVEPQTVLAVGVCEEDNCTKPTVRIQPPGCPTTFWVHSTDAEIVSREDVEAA